MVGEISSQSLRQVEAEVVVVGGGLSGVSASVSSSRAGASTILVERCAFPGGTSTAGLMSSTTNFYVTGKGLVVAKGFPYELVERLARIRKKGNPAVFQTVPQIPHDPEKLKVVLIDLLDKAGVTYLFHTAFSSCVRRRGMWTLVFHTRSGSVAIKARAVVDATGDASVVLSAGGRVVPAPGSASLEFRMADVDLEKLVEYIASDPSQYDEYCDVESTASDLRNNWEEFGIFHLPHGNGRKMKIVQEAVRRGRYPRTFGIVSGMDAFGMYGLRESRTAIINTGFITGDFLDPFFLSRAEAAARRAAQIASDFLVREMPGFEESFLVQTACELGIRTTRRIRGLYELKRSEIESACRFPDSIAVGSERRIGGPRFEDGFDVPFRILLPEGVEGIVVASGKTASTDPAGLLRAQVMCMQLGQAAGVAAAISAREGITPSRLDPVEIQRELSRQGAFIRDADGAVTP